VPAGKVVRKNDKGFGFIEYIDDDGVKQDVFFHATALHKEPGFDWDSMQVGHEVEFDEPEHTERGWRTNGVARA